MTKKVTAAILALLISLLLAACAGRTDPAGQNQIPAGETEITAANETEAAVDGVVPVPKEDGIEFEPVSDGEYMEYLSNGGITEGSFLEQKYMYDAEGNIVPYICSVDTMLSNPRRLIRDGDYSTVVSGPDIVINGYAFPEGHFYCRQERAIADGDTPYMKYCICEGCLWEAGVRPTGDSGATNGELISADHNCMDDPTELEQDVTFRLLSYDEDTCTYYFEAVNEGPFAGQSVIFQSYFGQVGYYSLPRIAITYSKGTERAGLPGIPGNVYIMAGMEGLRWDSYGASRNECRRMLNEEYGTELDDLGYDGDTAAFTGNDIYVLRGIEIVE